MRLAELANHIMDPDYKAWPAFRWPDRVTPPASTTSGIFGRKTKNVFWDRIVKLRKYTDVSSDKFSEQHQGSTGWEYDSYLVYVDGRVLMTEPHTSKDYESVSSGRMVMQIRTELDEKNKTVIDNFEVNDKTVCTLEHVGMDAIMKRNTRIGNNDYRYGFVCHFHTHPLVKLKGAERPIYTFFSRQDLISFMNSNLQMQGLVTDRAWLLCKTAESELPLHRALHHVTVTEAADPGRLISEAGDTMSRYGFVLYVAQFGEEFVRIA